MRLAFFAGATIFVFWMLSSSVFAQNSLVREPLSHTITNYKSELNRLFVNQHQSFNLLLSGDVNTTSEKLTPSESTPLFELPEGNTQIQIKQANGSILSIPVVVDGTPPSSSLDLLYAPQYTSETTLYIGKQLRTTLSAEDKSSGINTTYWATNNNPFTPFGGEETAFDTEGLFHLFYYSVDNVGNIEPMQQKEFVVDLSGPEISYSIQGIQQFSVLSPNTSISLLAKDKDSGTSQLFFWFDEGSPELYSTTLPLNSLADGEHILYAYATDMVENISDTLSFSFYLDKNAPEIIAEIDGNNFEQTGTIYISPSSSVSFNSLDNKSGASRILYRVNQEKEKTYTNAFQLPQVSGRYTLSFSVSDAVGNTSDPQSIKLYMDASPPKSSVRFEGYYSKTPTGYTINTETKIYLDGADLESGLNQVLYRLNNSEWTSLNKALRFDTPGTFTLQYQSLDNVGNKEEVNQLQIKITEITQPLAFKAAPEKPTGDGFHFYKTDQHIEGPREEFLLWLSFSDSASSEKFLLTSPSQKELLTFLPDADKQNILSISVDGSRSVYPLIIDGTPPEITLTTSGANHITNSDGNIYAPGVTIEIAATDNITGVKSVFTSENGSNYLPYEKPLQGYFTEQQYQIRYYATDSVGNASTELDFSFRIDATPPITIHQFVDNYSGTNVSELTTFSLSSSDNISGIDSIFIQLNNNRPVLYKGMLRLGELGTFTESLNTISYFAVDKVGNREQKKQLNIKIDKAGPVSTLIWDGATYSNQAVTYVHPSATFSIRAEDSGMDIRDRWFTLNDGAKATYNQPVSIGGFNQISIEYASVDILGNQGLINRESIIVDKKAPESMYNIKGKSIQNGQNLILGHGAEITLSSSDGSSGISELMYSINSEQLTRYTRPIQFKTSGSKMIRFKAVDNVGNTEQMHILNVSYDQSPPEIDLSYSELPISESERRIRLLSKTLISIKSTDRLSEVQSLEYKLDDGSFIPYIMPVSMANTGSYTLTVKTVDLLGNEQIKSVEIEVEE